MIVRARTPQGVRAAAILIGATNGGRLLTRVIEQAIGADDVADRDRLERDASADVAADRLHATDPPA